MCLTAELEVITVPLTMSSVLHAAKTYLKAQVGGRGLQLCLEKSQVEWKSLG